MIRLRDRTGTYYVLPGVRKAILFGYANTLKDFSNRKSEATIPRHSMQ